ncbi:MAG: hypothetical protein RJB38_2034 [Pseudomonadota bacterium]|jgi:hypothetical protein
MNERQESSALLQFDHLSTHRYRVYLPGALSSQAPREGALLRVEWRLAETNFLPGWGYADLMAWPELGDLSLEEECLAIIRGSPTSLGLRALAMSQLDAQARLERRSLWQQTPEPPRSHYLAGSVEDLLTLDYSSLARRGFQTVKVKAAKTLNLTQAKAILQASSTALLGHDLKLRVDFNGSASLDLLSALLSELEPSRFEWLDFLEDPFSAESLDEWITLKHRFPQVRLFVDRAETPKDDALLELADGWVLKPALQDPLFWIHRAQGKPFCFTQYLGHAVGAAWASWYAARTASGSAIDSGLLYESRIDGESEFFSKSIGSESACFETGPLRKGDGIGWTDTDWNSLSWSPWK